MSEQQRTVDLVPWDDPGWHRMGRLYDREQRRVRRQQTMSQLYTFRATVLRVVDADTLDLSFDLGFKIQRTERIRLAEVNAWETRGAEREQGFAAKARVEQLCPVGSEVLVRTNKAGKYNRYIAHITLPSGHDLGKVLLEEGHARLYGA